MTTERERINNRESSRRYRERQRKGKPARHVGRPRSGNGRPWKVTQARCPVCGEVISAEKDCKCPTE